MNNHIQRNPDGSISVTLTEEDFREMHKREADPSFHALCSSKGHRHVYRRPDGSEFTLCRPTAEQQVYEEAMQVSFLLGHDLLSEDELPQAVHELLSAGWLIPEDLPITTLAQLSAGLDRAVERGLPPYPGYEDEDSEETGIDPQVPAVAFSGHSPKSSLLQPDRSLRRLAFLQLSNRL